MTTMKLTPRILICLVLLGSTLGGIWDSSAARQVQQGIQSFLSGDYEAAGQAFDAADSAEPENDRITFDRACALNAQGKLDEARELFQTAALSRDAGLAADAHYNIGNLTAAKARDVLGSDPVNVDPQQRPEVISGLLAAVGHYRDGLRMNETHSQARHNLELIRQYIKHIQAEWEKRDREKAREDLGLLEFLAMIEARQQDLRVATRVLMNQDESPQQRQAIRESAGAQRSLHEEIEPLKQKMTSELQNAAGSQASQDSDNQRQQIQMVLHQLADEVGNTMLRSADQMRTDDLLASRQTQREILDQLNEIYMILVPFQNLLQRAIPVQEELIGKSEQVAELLTPSGPADPGDAADSTQASTQSSPAAPSAAITEQQAEDLELPWQQSRISNWGHLLSLKAQNELPQIEAQLEAVANTDELAPQQDDPTATPNAADQLNALAESLKKAIELAPQVEEHSVAAESHLESDAVDEALLDQQEALRLLKEIAEPLSQQQNQDDQQQDQQDSDQSQQDQQNDKPDDQQQQDQEEEQNQEQDKQTSREQAESVLRRAREREREHREQEKELRKTLRGVIAVDRDW